MRINNRKGRRKNCFKLYLAFRQVYFLDSFLLRAGGILLNLAEGTVIFCPKILLHSFPGVLANKLARLFTPTSVLKLKIPFQISSDEKPLFLAWRALANHLAFFLLLHFIRSCYSFGLLQWLISPSLSNQLGVMECR